jgi:hypothetical protein
VEDSDVKAPVDNDNKNKLINANGVSLSVSPYNNKINSILPVEQDYAVELDKFVTDSSTKTQKLKEEMDVDIENIRIREKADT